MAAYATRRDLYRYGLPRGVLGAQARLVDSAKASTDTITLDSHGFETDDEIVLRPADGGTMPGGLTSGATYYAIRLTDTTFKVAATAGGAAIDITADGVSVLVASPLPIDETLEVYSRFVDGFIPHLVPLTAPYPQIVVATVAELAAKKLLALAGHASASVAEFELAAKAKLERWATGVPLRDANATASSNKAVVTSLAVTGIDPRGWGSGSLP